MTTRLERPALAVVLAIGLSGPLRAESGPAAAEPFAEDLESLWADLSGNEMTASRSLLKLSARPQEAVEMIAGRLKPLILEEARLASLLADLGSPDDAKWKTAARELEYFDPRLAMELSVLMEAVTDEVPRARLVEILSGIPAKILLDRKKPITIGRIDREATGVFYNFGQGGSSWWAEHRVDRINVSPDGNLRKDWTRAVRAIVLLEHIGTPAAIAVLVQMSGGHPQAQPTKAAQEALGRLRKWKSE